MYTSYGLALKSALFLEMCTSNQPSSTVFLYTQDVYNGYSVHRSIAFRSSGHCRAGHFGGIPYLCHEKDTLPMYPKFILVSDPKKPLVGTFVYGKVWNHKDLFEAYEKVHGYVKIHGGGWYEKDDARKTVTLYGESGDYGAANLSFLNRIPRELEEYSFYYTRIHGLPGNKLDLTDVEWF